MIARVYVYFFVFYQENCKCTFIETDCEMSQQVRFAKAFNTRCNQKTK